MKLGSFKELIEAAEPADDAFDRRWVRSRVLRSLFDDAEEKQPQVGRFVLGDKLGVGGMGVVYAARDPELARDVAVKLVRVRDSGDREQTHLEAQALARINHPNVVAVYDVGLVDDQVYIVMEFVRGETLRDYASVSDRRPRDVASVYRQACEGLEAAHREGLIHRDFKPENAIVGDDGRVRVIDFGLAHEHEERVASSGAGTPRYMAPEQARGDELTPAADQYALCVALREALAAVSSGSIPAWLESIADRGASEDPDERFPDMGSVATALARDPRAIRRKRLVGAGALVAVVAAFSIGTYASSSDEKPRCEGGAELIEAVWPTAEWTSAATRLSASGEFGSAVVNQLTARFEPFRERWAVVHHEACTAHESGAQSAELLDRQMVCLDRAKRAFHATGELVTSAKKAEIAQLAVVAQSLPPPDRCLDLDALTAVAPPRKEIAQRASIVSQDLAAVVIDLDAGRFEKAHKRSAELVAEATALGYQPLVAEAKLLHGRALLLLKRSADAIPVLAEASEIAFAGGADQVGVEAWARWAYVTGMKEPRTPLAGAGVVRALSRRIGTQTFASGLLENNIGTLHIADGDHDSARVALARAADTARQLKGPGTVEALHAIGNLSMVTADPVEREQLAAESVSRFTELVGAEHPLTRRAMSGQAQVVAPARAVVLLEKVCTSLRRHDPGMTKEAAECFLDLAWAHDLNGNADAAANAAQEAFGLAPTAYPVASGLHLALEGKFEQSIEILRPLEAREATLTNLPWWLELERAEIVMVLGRAYQLSGDRRGERYIKKALASLRSIENQPPVVENRLRTAERWLESSAAKNP